MKKYFALAVLILVALSCNLVTPETLTPQALLPEAVTATPSPTLEPTVAQGAPELPLVDAPELKAMRFLDEMNGWGVTSTAVVRTNDGGVTWYLAGIPSVSDLSYPAAAYFLDAEHAWVAVTDPGGDLQAGTLYRTSDSGLSWETSSIPAGMGGVFSFVDAGTGFYTSGLGAGAGSMWVAVYASEDGGTTWQPRYVPEPGVPEAAGDLPGSGMKNGATFLSATRGWVGGNIPMEDFIYLYKTEDGGSTWELQPVEPPADLGPSFSNTYPPQFFGENGILPVTLVGNVTNLAIYTSPDGGLTWSLAPAFVANAGRGDLVDFVSPQDGFAYANGRFAVTHDAAQTWETVTPSMAFGDTLSALDFASLSAGWALTMDESGNTSLYRTSDGGVNWDILIP